MTAVAATEAAPGRLTVVVTGAGGFIGSAVAADLEATGHTVVCVVRRSASTRARPARVLDFASATDADFDALLLGADAVINCVGLLQDGPADDVAAAHATGADRLFAACERRGVRRVVHFSAVGVDRAQVSSFSGSKHEGDRRLMARDLDWVILRPSVVLGRGAVGASALVRGLAALPVVPVMPAEAPLQVVRLEDVVATVRAMVRPEAPARLSLELVGPERLTFADLVATYRTWLGWGPARAVAVPAWLAAGLYRLGDLVGLLGWRPVLRSNAGREIARGAIGDGRAWSEATGLQPRSLAAALASDPATVQDRWHAALYLLRPLILGVLAAFWIATGIVSLTNGYANGVDLMRRTPAASLAGPSVVAGALADLLIGLAILWRPTARLGLLAAIAMSLGYAVLGTILAPWLWNDPLGPLMKIWPIIALHLVALAVLGGRR